MWRRYLHGGNKETILFKSFRTTTKLGFYLALIVSFLLGFLFEGWNAFAKRLATKSLEIEPRLSTKKEQKISRHASVSSDGTAVTDDVSTFKLKAHDDESERTSIRVSLRHLNTTSSVIAGFSSFALKFISLLLSCNFLNNKSNAHK